jgi:hypothetical protein
MPIDIAIPVTDCSPVPTEPHSPSLQDSPPQPELGKYADESPRKKVVAIPLTGIVLTALFHELSPHELEPQVVAIGDYLLRLTRDP